ncbi:protein YebF [Xenorhabdus szentirmaii]|uniref:Protein yebF n=1 Tax=Xenorhabdus szentirmaii DSM 16338 TaxID=1427518 RepID=W1ISW8_9GAMM|nr:MULTISPECIES: protein YebF [Xenorhabdus]MBD2779769.1 hypothetical protein [Xenorhabdus sp. 38]MBD2793443.1 hypothetical protein [Xenorhabdus sp. CUL]MBD2819548.1 hypothetical protein [Xenorhabdus sp. 42]MBD2826234.1 hypothetical protein [Xenorhabdus sp. 5]PHM32319.1 Colicin-M immunity protein [Xenorhabdus szentirmaii DSM 16338]
MKINRLIRRVGLLSAGILFSVSLTATAAGDERVAKFISCENLTKDQVAAQVKQDFLQNRINHWEKDRKQLGTSKPIAWVNVNDIIGDQNVLQVPLNVRGSKKDKSYNVTIDCHEGTISYSESK